MKITRLPAVFLLLFLLGCKEKPLTYDQSVERLNTLLKSAEWRENYVKRKEMIEMDKTELRDNLPDISQYPLAVDPGMSGNDLVLEIFSSTEKSGTGTDGWLVETAEKFNLKNVRSGNKTIRIRIRKIDSGVGYEFIASGKYRPDAFTPSNILWIKMIDAFNVKTIRIEDRLLGNVAGVVMKKSKAKEIREKNASITMRTLVDLVVQGELAMGYTNPFASSTGINFLVSVLDTFANGDQKLLLTPEVASAFEAFQTGVPFVALTTIQMRDSVKKNGSLDAFVLEYQTFIKIAELVNDYEFIPFGIRHDNPLYGIGELSNEKVEALKTFAAYCREEASQKNASAYGFNRLEEYLPAMNAPEGSQIISAQKLWKEKKDSGREIAAVFLCDVSGSMAGEPMINLKKALLEGSRFINQNNSIGLAAFSTRVETLLPIRKFDMNHQSSFFAAVSDMSAEGNTAMFDGIAVSLKMLADYKATHPDVKPMLFVLTDGESNRGLEFGDLSGVLNGMTIPVYTIGYNANIDVLKEVSAINEAATINAQTDDVIYRIGTLLNAQM